MYIHSVCLPLVPLIWASTVFGKLYACKTIVFSKNAVFGFIAVASFFKNTKCLRIFRLFGTKIVKGVRKYLPADNSPGEYRLVR